MSDIKTHSIVTEECLLRVNHKGVPVTYKPDPSDSFTVTGWLIRYVTTCDHHLLALSTSEARECLELNRTSDISLV